MTGEMIERKVRWNVRTCRLCADKGNAREAYGGALVEG